MPDRNRSNLSKNRCTVGATRIQQPLREIGDKLREERRLVVPRELLERATRPTGPLVVDGLTREPQVFGYRLPTQTREAKLLGLDDCEPRRGQARRRKPPVARAAAARA